ncbi:MAG: hypothetical protein A2Y77_07290 [Planctomycetes bacterium RBG_13_62_9]|nr:MAG: hypothetical protein A2Y77_07290 [Planctomycetes bacterium RBG_13_62_9]
MEAQDQPIMRCASVLVVMWVGIMIDLTEKVGIMGILGEYGDRPTSRHRVPGTDRPSNDN